MKGIRRQMAILLMKKSGKNYAEMSKILKISWVRTKELYLNAVRDSKNREIWGDLEIRFINALKKENFENLVEVKKYILLFKNNAGKYPKIHNIGVKTISKILDQI